MDRPPFWPFYRLSSGYALRPTWTALSVGFWAKPRSSHHACGISLSLFPPIVPPGNGSCRPPRMAAARQQRFF
eukprot:scaffold2408_cov200-Pinguiococcus_pyrenoidosus.AAC.1